MTCRCPRCGERRVSFRLVGGMLARLGWRAFVCPTCGRRFRSFARDVEEAPDPIDESGESVR